MRVIVSGKMSEEGREELLSCLNRQGGGGRVGGGLRVGGGVEGRHHPKSSLASCWLQCCASQLLLLLKLNGAGECGFGMGE